MASISKNIKRLRTAQKLTQEQLAVQLNVTRQTISSWENDRTQPDINMLAALSTALNTDIEDLIYGKKKHVGFEADPAEKRRTLSLVLIIMGCLLVAVGVVFLFVFFWRELPDVMKKSLALLPLIVGVGAGLFATLTKKKTVPLREGAAVLWFAGVIASNALVNSMFTVDFGFEKLLIADTFLLLPVPFLLDSVFAYTAEIALSMTLVWRQILDEAELSTFFFGAAAFLICVVFLFKNDQIKPVKQFCVWIWLLGAGATAAGGAMYAIHGTDYEDMSPMIFVSVLFCFFLALFIAGTEKRFELRFTLPVGAVLSASMPAFTAVAFVDNSFDHILDYGPVGYAALLCLMLLFLAPALISGKTGNKGNKIKRALIAVWALFFLSQLLLGVLVPVVTLAFSLTAGVLTVMAGVKRGKLLICNFGMVQLAANVFILLADLKTADLFWIGAVFVLMGAAFLIINKIMIKKFEARRAAQAAQRESAEESEATQDA